MRKENGHGVYNGEEHEGVCVCLCVGVCEIRRGDIHTACKNMWYVSMRDFVPRRGRFTQMGD